MPWNKNGTPDTLTSAGDTLTISDLTAKKFHMIMGHTLWSTNGGVRIIFDNDTGNVYAERRSVNGGSDVTTTSTNNIDFWADNTKRDAMHIGYICNIDGEEALFIGFAMNQGSTGAGTAPDRREIVGKDSGTTQFTRVDLDNENPSLGDILTDSNMSMIGTD